MFYFRTRALRNAWFKEHNYGAYNLVDEGTDAPEGRRWAVQVL